MSEAQNVTAADGLRRSPGLRDGYNAFIARHDVAWELGMAFLAVVFVALGFLIDETDSGARPELEALELVITVVFAAEFASRLLAARDRARYVRGHWIDLVALVPPVRGARLLRLLRLLRLIRGFAGIYRAVLHVERLSNHRGFAWLVVSWLAVMVGCSFGIYVAEHGVNQAIESPFDAFWWGIVTLSTVGYGDVYPVTAEGRLLASILMVLGIGLFSAITATITSYLLVPARGAIDRGGDLVSDFERLASLRDQGSLTEDEFACAKARLLAGPSGDRVGSPRQDGRSRG